MINKYKELVNKVTLNVNDSRFQHMLGVELNQDCTKYTLIESSLKDIIRYYVQKEQGKKLGDIFTNQWQDTILDKKFSVHSNMVFCNLEAVYNESIWLRSFLGVDDICRVENEALNRTIDVFNHEEFVIPLLDKIALSKKAENDYLSNDFTEYYKFILTDTFYPFVYDCSPEIEYNRNNKSLVIDYYLPNIDEIPNEVPIKKGIKEVSKVKLKEYYDKYIYAISVRTVAEIFNFDYEFQIDDIFFNGRLKTKDSATGQDIDICILSFHITRDFFRNIDLAFVEPKACIKKLKGICASRLSSMTPIMPICEINREDKRFIESYNVNYDSFTNLAEISWEDFEHLVREIFDLEFNQNGGEVKVTQASRDGGVDAIAFDPDPIRGGKFVIQAKRYTNTVGVSAVRDLYGTLINEGANKGILITTSDYGADSYEFANGKPITLLNGGNLLALMQKHGKYARINLQEAINKRKSE